MCFSRAAQTYSLRFSSTNPHMIWRVGPEFVVGELAIFIAINFSRSRISSSVARVHLPIHFREVEHEIEIRRGPRRA